MIVLRLFSSYGPQLFARHQAISQVKVGCLNWEYVPPDWKVVPRATTLEHLAHACCRRVPEMSPNYRQQPAVAVLCTR